MRLRDPLIRSTVWSAEKATSLAFRGVRYGIGHLVSAAERDLLEFAGPVAGTRMTDEYLDQVGRLAYLWGWPLVNVHNRLSIMEQVPEPGLLGGMVPAAPPGSVAMLHDYIRPDQRLVACPNQDVVYGFGALDARRGPSVVQVPDFGDRFWVYQAVDQRTDSFVRLGSMYGTKPGLYLLAPSEWDGAAPDGITEVFRFDTRIAVVVPRVFMDDTDADRVAIQAPLNQVMVYPLEQYTGSLKSTDWGAAPTLPAGAATEGEEETQWVVPEHFFAELPAVLEEVPARPGEEALYAWFGSLVDAAHDPHVADVLARAAVNADDGLVRQLFEFRNIGLPVAYNWTTQRNGAAFGTDYLSRTAMAKANIFVNTLTETAYFYQDLDASGARLDGSHAYTLTFEQDALPPVRGFWSLTLYNEHHFFHRNPLNRYSLGTKNRNLKTGPNGSLTLHISTDPPADESDRSNWMIPPQGDFSVYLRAYWPEQAVLDGVWTPPPVQRTD
jgi:hypothetical protein